MKLLRIGSGLWSVCAVLDENGGCDVLDQLILLGKGNKNEQGLAKKMRRILEQWVPDQTNGPKFNNTQISKYLRDGIYEFLRGQKTGPKLRVLWFYGDGNLVVCTSCFLKRNKTPDGAIGNAIEIKKRYEIAKSRNEVEIIGF